MGRLLDIPEIENHIVIADKDRFYCSRPDLTTKIMELMAKNSDMRFLANTSVPTSLPRLVWHKGSYPFLYIEGGAYIGSLPYVIKPITLELVSSSVFSNETERVIVYHADIL